jgi:hypothetical protein
MNVRETEGMTSDMRPSGFGLFGIVLNKLRFALVGIWFGAALFFSATVAPAAFGVLRNAGVANASELAGSIVNRTLGVVYISGCVVALLAISGSLFLRSQMRRNAFATELASLVLLGVTSGVGRWVWMARMQSLRTQIGAPIESLAMDHPLRIAFDSLHGYSVVTLGIGLVAALVSLLVIAWQRH